MNEKRRELDRGSQLLTFENEASHTLKFLVSYIDQITKVAYEIGKNEEQAKQLARTHKDLVDSVNVSRIFHTFSFSFISENRAYLQARFGYGTASTKFECRR